MPDFNNAFDRQIKNRNFLSPAGFKFSLAKAPKVDFFSQSVSIPNIDLGVAVQTTYLRDIPVPGDKLTYGELNMTFLVDENLENYQEIHGWLVGLGFPRDHSEFRNLIGAGSDRFPVSNESVSTEPGKVKFGSTDQGPNFSDATLTVLSSKNNPQVEIRFRDLFPVSLTGLQYDQQAADVEYLTSTVTFRYTIYDFANVGSSTTQVTTS